jgi:hypothetical protein
MILFNEGLFGSSYQVTYQTATEIQSIHAFCREDDERVTGADVLPKNHVPGFVDVTINVEPNPTSTTTPNAAGLAQLLKNQINTISGSAGLTAASLVQILLAQGVTSVDTPFTMTATVLNTDGSSSVYTSQNNLSVPAVTLASQTDNFVTPRIVFFYARNVIVTGLS